MKKIRQTLSVDWLVVHDTLDKHSVNHLPMSSIRGAILNVIPTNSKHINNKRHAVAMIVHRARCDISSGSIT